MGLLDRLRRMRAGRALTVGPASRAPRNRTTRDTEAGSDELVDALPVHLVTVRDGALLERYVVPEGDGLGWQDDAPSTPARPAGSPAPGWERGTSRPSGR